MAERIPTEQLTEQVRDAIIRLNRRLRRERPVGDLTVAQFSALISLRIGGALTPRELADIERVQPPTMTKIIARLEERGLIKRVPHPTDRRQVVLSPTDEGVALHDSYQRVRDVWLASKLGDLDPADQEILAKAAALLKQLAQG